MASRLVVFQTILKYHPRYYYQIPFYYIDYLSKYRELAQELGLLIGIEAGIMFKKRNHKNSKYFRKQDITAHLANPFSSKIVMLSKVYMKMIVYNYFG